MGSSRPEKKARYDAASSPHANTHRRVISSVACEASTVAIVLPGLIREAKRESGGMQGRAAVVFCLWKRVRAGLKLGSENEFGMVFGLIGVERIRVLWRAESRGACL